jgi:uncharacterized coiled-coil DUF342 family protein
MKLIQLIVYLVPFKGVTMAKVQVVSQVELEIDEVIKGVERLEPDELEHFLDRVMTLRAQRRAPSLPQEEAELLQKINQGVPNEVRSRYDELHEKLLDETLKPDEQQEFIELSDQIEFADAERLKHLILLAQLRNVTVDSLMDQLGLRRRVYA